MRSVVSYFKLAAFALCLSCFFIMTLPLVPWLQRGSRKVRPILMKATSLASVFMTRVLGLEVEVVGEKDAFYAPGARLMVSNHMSYVDVLLLATQRPACFVTSQEIKETPGLGIICQAGGCLFVNRKNRRNLGGEVKELSEAMRAGMSVTIFPEATSSNGHGVLKFRRPLFNAAIDAGVPVLPLTLNYLSIDDVPVGPDNRDVICWYGDMPFFSHIMTLFKSKKIKAQIVVGKLLPPTIEVTELTEVSYEQVVKHFKPLGPPPVS